MKIRYFYSLCLISILSVTCNSALANPEDADVLAMARGLSAMAKFFKDGAQVQVHTADLPPTAKSIENATLNIKEAIGKIPTQYSIKAPSTNTWFAGISFFGALLGCKLAIDGAISAIKNYDNKNALNKDPYAYKRSLAQLGAGLLLMGSGCLGVYKFSSN